ncbi:MAG: hypothetical protein QW282_04180 [Nitrososphaerales archaeon]
MIPKLFVRSKGVPQDDVEHIVKVIKECYGTLQPTNLEAVEVNIFQRSSEALAFLSSQAQAAGVKSSGYDEEFYAYHHAWTGLPSIIISIEKLSTLTSILVDACIRHEVAHTVLHGELRYYVIPLPPAYQKLKRCLKLPEEYLLDLTYLTSIAVKDYEATKLLYEHNFKEDQLKYAEHLLDEGLDISLWKIVEHNPSAKALFLTANLKVLFCIKPLLNQKNIHLRKKLEDCLYPLHEYQQKMIEIVDEATQHFSEDTYYNIQVVAENHSQKILQKIFNINLYKSSGQKQVG